MDKWTIGYEADNVSLIMPRQNAADLLYALTLALGPTSLSPLAATTPLKPAAVYPGGSTPTAGGSTAVAGGKAGGKTGGKGGGKGGGKTGGKTGGKSGGKKPIGKK